jgi:(E)-4-hydroxy-3-methylbut-2-enyl-diphosphate synthase
MEGLAPGRRDSVARRISRAVRVGDVTIGGGAPVVVQGMTKTDTRDVAATVAQIRSMAEAGAQVVRVAVPNRQAAEALPAIRRQSPVPLVADIHFDYRLALAALQAGVDKLRLNPGNIGDAERVRQVVRAAKERGVPIRIGVNAGSLEKPLLQRYGHPTAEAMVESAMRHLRILWDLDFFDVVVSLKASTVPLMVQAYRLLAEQTDVPLHLGVTEAGTAFSGTVKSAIGIGALLLDGIGDTIRVSLAAPPEEEIRVAREILRDLGLLSEGVNIVACPTCGRLQYDMQPVVDAVEKALSRVKEPIRVAIMGCAVNGPGEAREADVGIAGGKGGGLLFRRGQVVGRVEEKDLVDTLLREVMALVEERRGQAEDGKGLEEVAQGS